MSQQINLFNPVFLKKEKYFSAVTMTLALGMLLVASAVISGYVASKSLALGKEADTTAALLKSAEAQVIKLAGGGAPEKNPALDGEIEKAETELASMRQVSDVLNRGEMGNTQGYAEYLRAFARQIIGGVWLTGFSIQGAGNEIAIEGRALQPNLVPAYIGRLKSEPIMQGKSFSALEIRVPEPAAAKAGSAAPSMAPFVDFTLQSAGSREPEKAGAKAR